MIRWWLLGVITLIICDYYGSAKSIEGQVYTTTRWSFITRFVFSNTIGGLEYRVKYPSSYSNGPKMVIYYIENWSRVYPGKNQDCSNKMDYAFNTYEVDKPLNTSYKYLNCINHGNIRHCEGKIQFMALTGRWWLLVLSQCHGNNPLDAEYEFTVTDGTSWEKQVSADESDLFLFTVITLFIFSVASVISFVFYYKLLKLNFLHIPYKMFLVGLSYEVGALGFELCYYIVYIERGKQLATMKAIGSILHAASDTVLILLLLILAKGYTVTRGRLKRHTLIRLGIFATLYGIACVTNVAMEIDVTSDQGLVRNSLDDGAEVGVMVFTMMSWAWFLYAVIQTVDKYPEKLVFYSWFSVVYSAWFVARPAITVFARFTLADWKINKVTKGVNLALCTMGYMIFLQLTRPTAANRQFPFHVRTNQIDILTTNETADFPHTEEYSRLKKEAKGDLETSLTSLNKQVDIKSPKKQGIVSVWFSGSH